MSKTEWVNMGDINFLAYGGCLVKPHFSEEELKDHESLENTFDVFYLNTEFGENGDENFAALCYVDLDDSWLPWADMLKCIGLDEEVGLSVEELVKKHSPMLLAKELVEYAGVQNFSPEVVKTIPIIGIHTQQKISLYRMRTSLSGFVTLVQEKLLIIRRNSNE